MRIVCAFNQEKALVGAFSVIVNFCRWIVCSTEHYRLGGWARAMSGSGWLAGWADSAETLLNQLDRGAAEVLSSKQSAGAGGLDRVDRGDR